MTKNNVFGENKCDQLIKGCDVTIFEISRLMTHNRGHVFVSRDHFLCFFELEENLNNLEMLEPNGHSSSLVI